MKGWYENMAGNVGVPKRVRFDDENLTQITIFTDDEVSVDMRKCYWEIYARDRYRFKERISRIEPDLNKIFQENHRDRMYNLIFRTPKGVTSKH